MQLNCTAMVEFWQVIVETAQKVALIFFDNNEEIGYNIIIN